MRKAFTWGAYALLACGFLFGAFPRGFASLKPHEILLLAMVAWLLILYIIDGRISGFSTIDIGFALIIAMGTVLPVTVMEARGIYITSDALKSLLAPLEYYLWYRVFLDALPMPIEMPRLIRRLLVMITIIGLCGDLQVIHFPGITTFLNIVSDTHQATVSGSVARPTSLVGEWGLLASITGFGLFLLNQLMTGGYGPTLFGRRWRIWFFATMAINVFALVATLAVEGFIALALGYGIAYLINHQRLARETWIGIGIGGVSLLALTPILFIRLDRQFGNSGSIIPATWQIRFFHWQVVLQSIWSSPGTVFLGVNPSFIYPVSQFQGTESLYWLLWYRGGLLYLAAFLIFLGTIIVTAWQDQQRSHGLEQAFLRWIFTVFVVISCIGVIDALFVDGGEVQMLMTLAAALGSITLRQQRHRQRETPQPAPRQRRLYWRSAPAH